VTSSSNESRLDAWRRRLDDALARLRERAGLVPDDVLREAATARAASMLRAHPWPATLLAALARLADGGAAAYLVGGTVRDALLGRAGDSAADVATSLPPDEVVRRFARVEPVGIAHGTVLVLEPGVAIECTTFRREHAYTDARHPDAVTFSSDPLEDLARRDFTVNALAYDPATGELLDPFGGALDLERRMLRAVGDPAARFHEDALRPLRAARLAAVLGLEVEPATAAAMATVEDRARLIAIERVRSELERLLRAATPSTGFELLRRAGLLRLWMPELDACAGVPQNRFHAYDVYEHSLRACDAAQADRPIVRWAALLHDIGKPATRVIRRGDATFYGHDLVGAGLADTLLARLRFPNDERERIVHLVRHHMFDFRRDWTDAALRRWLRKVGVDAVADLFDLRLADAAATGLAQGHPAVLDDMRRRIARLLDERHALTVRDLAVGGADVMAALGIPPGPRVGEELEALLDQVLEDPALNRRDALLARLAARTGR